MKRNSVLRFVAILLVAYAALTAGFHWIGPWCAAPLLPVLEHSLELSHPEFVGPKFTIRQNRLHLETVIKNDSALPERQRIMSVSSDLSASQLFVCPIIALSLLFSWPHKSKKKLLLAFILALGLITVVESLDAPYAFAAAFAEKMQAPVSVPRDFDSFWWFFLDNGGRQMLALLVAPLAVLGTRLVPTWLTTSLDPVKSSSRRRKRPSAPRQAIRNTP